MGGEGRLKSTWSHHRLWVVIEHYCCRLHCSSIFSPTPSNEQFQDFDAVPTAPLTSQSILLDKPLHCTMQLMVARFRAMQCLAPSRDMGELAKIDAVETAEDEEKQWEKNEFWTPGN
jgi:hypothetical protein